MLRVSLLGSCLSLLCFAVYSRASLEVVDLGSLSWVLSNEDQSVIVPGSVPGDAHLDLWAANVIGDPYYGQNDVNLRWIAYDNWTYSTTLPDLATWSTCFDNVYLVFNGIDTFATVTLGNTTLGSVNNQWRQWVFDIGTELQSIAALDAAPTLSVAFTSAVVEANYLGSLPGQEIFPNASISWFEFGNRMYIRKEQCDFGWDWGPAFAPQGIWRPAYMVGLTSLAKTATVPSTYSAYTEVTTDDAFNFTTEVYGNPTSLYVANNDVDVYRLGQMPNIPPDQTAPWVVNVSLDVLPTTAALNGGLAMMIDIAGVQNSGWLTTDTTNTSVTGSMIVPNDAVELWWPYNLGTPKLYNLTVTLSNDTVTTLTTFTAMIGFRTIVLNMLPVLPNNTLGLTPGNNFHFEINGQAMYAKGSNWIPPDAFWPRVTEEKYRQLLGSVIAGNQNLLRVWAGGAYQDDLFYDLADEMGILMWSEFQFSDTPYPVDPDFLANVAVEVEYNTRRINRHPSLALWAGNNELEEYSYAAAEAAIPANASLYQSQFELLFLDTIHPIVSANSKSISWISASTTNGPITISPWVERYQNVTPGYIYGDEELYDYDPSQSFNSRYYPVSRFVNEFGFHSMPSIYSWQEVLNPADLWFNSTTILTREHHNPPDGLSRIGAGAYAGQGQMTIAVEMYYPIPNVTDTIANFSAWCWTTQVFQAQFMAAEIQFYRRGSGLPNRCLGSLYWQLEDIWQAPTWAGIEYSGRWKVLHYLARNVYSPVIVSPFYGNATLEIWATSDQLQAVSGSASWTWYDWAGEMISPTTTRQFTVQPVNSTMLYAAGNGTDIPVLPTNTTDENDAVLYLTLEATSADGQTHYTHENWFSPAYLNTAYLQDPLIALDTVYPSGSSSTSAPTFVVSAKGGIGALVFLEHPEGVLGYFSDNAFLLIPGQDRTLTFTVFSDTTGGAWVDGVTVRSIWNNTHLA